MYLYTGLFALLVMTKKQVVQEGVRKTMYVLLAFTVTRAAESIAVKHEISMKKS
jgi:hypothetical protein